MTPEEKKWAKKVLIIVVVAATLIVTFTSSEWLFFWPLGIIALAGLPWNIWLGNYLNELLNPSGYMLFFVVSGITNLISYSINAVIVYWLILFFRRSKK